MSGAHLKFADCDGQLILFRCWLCREIEHWVILCGRWRGIEHLPNITELEILSAKSGWFFAESSSEKAEIPTVRAELALRDIASIEYWTFAQAPCWPRRNARGIEPSIRKVAETKVNASKVYLKERGIGKINVCNVTMERCATDGCTLKRECFSNGRPNIATDKSTVPKCRITTIDNCKIPIVEPHVVKCHPGQINWCVGQLGYWYGNECVNCFKCGFKFGRNRSCFGEVFCSSALSQERAYDLQGRERIIIWELLSQLLQSPQAGNSASFDIAFEQGDGTFKSFVAMALIGEGHLNVFLDYAPPSKEKTQPPANNQGKITHYLHAVLIISPPILRSPEMRRQLAKDWDGKNRHAERNWKINKRVRIAFRRGSWDGERPVGIAQRICFGANLSFEPFDYGHRLGSFGAIAHDGSPLHCPRQLRLANSRFYRKAVSGCARRAQLGEAA